jgi:hypothetical protein
VEFEIILEKYQFPKRVIPAKTFLNQVETKFDVHFPDDYGTYLLNYCGFETSIGLKYVELWDIEQVVLNNELIFLKEYLPGANHLRDEICNCGPLPRRQPVIYIKLPIAFSKFQSTGRYRHNWQGANEVADISYLLFPDIGLRSFQYVEATRQSAC